MQQTIEFQYRDGTELVAHVSTGREGVKIDILAVDPAGKGFDKYAIILDETHFSWDEIDGLGVSDIESVCQKIAANTEWAYGRKPGKMYAGQ